MCYVYVYSGYCMQEFDVSYHHNIMVKRKKRLVILMALDSPSDLYANDTTDMTALRQYTYIDYAADDWLDKLLYALPVRGLLQRNQNEVNEGGQRPGYVQDDHALLMDSLEDTDVPMLQ